MTATATAAVRDLATGRIFTPDRTYVIYFPACGGLPARLEFRAGTYDYEGPAFRTEAEPRDLCLYLESHRDELVRSLGCRFRLRGRDETLWWPDRIEGAWRALVTRAEEEAS